MDKHIIILISTVIILITGISGCTSEYETNYTTYTTYNNSVMSFDYPDTWIIDYEGDDERSVFFNSTHGEIRVVVSDTYGMPSATDDKVAEKGVIGNKTYTRYEYDAESDSISYIIELLDDKELLVYGHPNDRLALLKIIETFQLITQPVDPVYTPATSMVSSHDDGGCTCCPSPGYDPDKNV